MSIPTATLEQKKQFLEDLKLLAKDQHYELFRILKRSNVEYSENSNGIFFDLNSVADDIFQKLTKYMELCKTQRIQEEDREKEIETLRKEANTT